MLMGGILPSVQAANASPVESPLMSQLQPMHGDAGSWEEEEAICWTLPP